MPQLTVSIVSNSNRELLDRCLASIFENTRDVEFEVIVVDNCSTDGTPGMVRDKYPSVRLIENEEPAGYSANHNRALREMRGDFVVIMNDDTEVLPGCFEAMCRFLDENPTAGCAGPRILNPDRTLQQSVYRQPSLPVLFFHAFFLDSIFQNSMTVAGFRKWPHDERREVEFMIGACLMFPREAIEKAGLMDERYFIYAEDADLCLEIEKAGYRVVFLPDAEIVHHGGTSMKKIGDMAIDNFYRSMELFFEKHYGRGVLPKVRLLNRISAFNRIAAFSFLLMFRPSKRDYYRDRIEHFRRVLEWHRKPPESGP